MVKRIGTLCLVIGGLICAAWLVGVVCSDRWVWSQWLSWLPVITLLPGIALLTAGRVLRGTTLNPALGGLCFVAVVGLQVLTLWRPASTIEADTLRIVHWTAGPGVSDAHAVRQVIEDGNADVFIALGTTVRDWGDLLEWGAIPGPIRRAEFTILSRYPVLTCRSLARVENIQLVLLELDVNREPMTILLLDLPSELTCSRMAIAHKARSLIETRLDTAPDLVIGDFNMTQHSAALKKIMPGWQTAWNEGGRGWGGTWPPQLPLWRIDHVLVPNDATPPAITTVWAGQGRHRTQLIDVVIDE